MGMWVNSRLSKIGFCLGQHRPKEGDLDWRYGTTFNKTRYLRVQNRLFQIILDSSVVGQLNFLGINFAS